MYTATFGKKWGDSRVIVQRGSDWMVAIIDPATGDYETVTPELTGQALEQLITGENGFEKPYEKWTYMYQESAFFPVDRFFRLMEGNRETIEEIAKQQIRVHLRYSRKPGWNMWRENACIRDGEFKKRKQGIIEYS